jgi:hypothetical protein
MNDPHRLLTIGVLRQYFFGILEIVEDAFDLSRFVEALAEAPQQNWLGVHASARA